LKLTSKSDRGCAGAAVLNLDFLGGAGISSRLLVLGAGVGFSGDLGGGISL